MQQLWGNVYILPNQEENTLILEIVNKITKSRKIGEGAYGKIYAGGPKEQNVIKVQNAGAFDSHCNAIKEIAIMRSLIHKSQSQKPITKANHKRQSIIRKIVNSVVEENINKWSKYYGRNAKPKPILNIFIRRLYAQQIASGLAFLHSNNVIHCNINYPIY